jgi:predicted RNA-binding Zn-ribbon protein involved in translation (DUF1610 family)
MASPTQAPTAAPVDINKAVAFACPACMASTVWNHGNATQQRCGHCFELHNVNVLLEDGWAQ